MKAYICFQCGGMAWVENQSVTIKGSVAKSGRVIKKSYVEESSARCRFCGTEEALVEVEGSEKAFAELASLGRRERVLRAVDMMIDGKLSAEDATRDDLLFYLECFSLRMKGKAAREFMEKVKEVFGRWALIEGGSKWG